MVSAKFSVLHKEGQDRYLEETFLLTETSMEVILGMLFVSFNNADIDIDTNNFIWRSYTALEDLPTTSQVKLINKKELAKAALDENSEIFVMDDAALVVTRADGIKVHYSCISQLALL